MDTDRDELVRRSRGAIVTGAARGLGMDVARRLLADGWAVALVDMSESVRDTAAQLGEQTGSSAVPVVADVSDPSDVERAVRESVEALGAVRLLVNNAGIGGGTTNLVDAPIAGIRRVLEVNLLGTILMAREAASRMIASGIAGTIVNIGSIFGQQGVAQSVAYGASKGGVTLVSQALAMELAPHGIRVNTVAPGNMATEMHWNDLRARTHARGVPFEAVVDEIRAAIPLGRHGTGDDVAGAVVWLASDDASYVTGQTIGVNGGVIRS